MMSAAVSVESGLNFNQKCRLKVIRTEVLSSESGVHYLCDSCPKRVTILNAPTCLGVFTRLCAGASTDSICSTRELDKVS